jgi:hypothetical protein
VVPGTIAQYIKNYIKERTGGIVRKLYQATLGTLVNNIIKISRQASAAKNSKGKEIYRSRIVSLRFN